ncbi:MlaD family protein [Palleronia sp.]|uniref:MlaD family protein n=1 Tax=Palleronia sp. TaxID=1940284 RepID=UPI0035C8761D
MAGFFGLLGFFLWFARVELDRQFDYYDVAFSSVSGLNNASDVRFAGLPVGQVVSVGFSPEGDGRIRVRVEVDAATPVRTNSIATIEAQGVTGVSFVSISPGSPDAPLLEPTASEPTPEIEAGRSVLQSLSEDAPELLAEALNIVQEVSDLLSSENRAQVERILSNVENASLDFSQALSDFSGVAGSVSQFATQIDSFNDMLAGLTSSMEDVLTTADDTLLKIGGLALDARSVLSAGVEALGEAQTAASEVSRYLSEDLSDATGEVQLTMAEARSHIDGLSSQAATTLGAIRGTADLASARLAQAEALFESADASIARVDTALAAVERAATTIDVVMTGDGAALIAETRAAVAETTEAVRIVTETAERDLPAIMANVRAATSDAKEAIGAIATDLSSATGRIDKLTEKAELALDSATTTFSNANEMLVAINSALVTGDAALAAAERAFQGADRVINEDVASITADLRTTLTELNSAIGQVAEDLPAITADLRGAATTAEGAFAELGPVISASGGAVGDFTSLARETRSLIEHLDNLVGQLQRDPARFFLNQRTPDFRR